ncbi:aminotransferase class I/II-fold pyridoxal phosphate-dependent enzyme [Amycolatopsis sp. OK19-0408]|uniref:Aminotransferase class I/II-fold pyridoxal phosphate-dependent enzyme n=1 Tax=Amycolatopsis iheyensis TaxID=2945988 RepID=A0A9X2SN71_9PSEU|nr:aminotransferase class I/II-fold pyridoxal phosphate-dependent enzyme [Amycolatopsis iheyensis]MCR6488439.1 aminotransferase class I/II-fold pyridoxal phosphate-dependent enzyme [Amycolatopsis iheyensis]
MTDRETTTTVDVVCLASSGASAREFARWRETAGAACRIVPLDLPGRGSKVRRPPARTLDDVVGGLLDELPAEREYALFGHSFGGLLAYELARRAAAEGRALPRFVVVAACRPPHDVSSALFAEAAELGDGEMLDALGAAGLISGSLRDSPAASVVVPALRADLRVLAGYVPPEPDRAAVPVDLVSWFGVADRAVSGQTAAKWRSYTSRSWSLRAFEGDHFFVREQGTACAEVLAKLAMSRGVTPVSAAVRRVRAVSLRPTESVPAGRGVALNMGEPDFATPSVIVDTAIEALRDGTTHYADLNGDPELRALIAAQASAAGVRAVSPADVLISHGGTAAVTASVLAVVDPGDRVVVPEPVYALYADAVGLAGGETVHVPGTPAHRLDFDALARALPGAKLVVLCNPVNPTGVVHSAAELAELGRLAADAGALVLVDEAYAHLVHPGCEFTGAPAVESLADRLIHVQTLSKTYAMTGWRIGYAVAPPEIAQAIKLVHRTVNGPVNSAVQRAALTALRHGPGLADGMLAAYTERRDAVLARLDAMPGVSAVRPDGAFYVLVRYPGERPSGEVAALLGEHGVAVRAGREYGPGGEGHVRISFATDLATLHAGLDRMAEVFALLCREVG